MSFCYIQSFYWEFLIKFKTSFIFFFNTITRKKQVWKAKTRWTLFLLLNGFKSEQNPVKRRSNVIIMNEASKVQTVWYNLQNQDTSQINKIIDSITLCFSVLLIDLLPVCRHHRLRVKTAFLFGFRKQMFQSRDFLHFTSSFITKS